MNKYAIFLSIMSLSLISCEKELDIDYHTVNPVYVIEGCVSNLGSNVRITRTVDMNEAVDTIGIRVDSVMVTDGYGNIFNFVFDVEDYHYYPSENLNAETGLEYTLSVFMDGIEYLSSSTMQAVPIIETDEFVWLSLLNTRQLFYSFTLVDPDPTIDNWFCYRMYRNGEQYKWDVFTDKGQYDSIVSHDIMCMDEDTAEKNDPDDWDKILYDGDKILLEVRVIDERTYNYLYSLGLGSITTANPIDNFTPSGCLGYFSAYGASTVSTTFTYDTIAD